MTETKPERCPQCQTDDNNPYIDANGIAMRACGRCMIQWRDTQPVAPAAPEPTAEQFYQRYTVGREDPLDTFKFAEAFAAERVSAALRHQNAALRKRIHHLEKHNQYFFRCESGWCNPSDDDGGNPAMETLKQLEDRALKAEREVEQLRAGPLSLRALMQENLELVREVEKLQAKLDYCAKHHTQAGVK